MDLLAESEVLLSNLLNNIGHDNFNSIQDTIETVIDHLTRTQLDFSEAIARLRRSLDILEESHPKKGRPPVFLPIESLEFLLGIGFKMTKIAEMYGVHTNTVANRLKEHGLSVRQTFTNMSDDDLDRVLNEILLEHPNTGYKRMQGFLKSRAVKISTPRLRIAMRRVDPEGVALRRRQNRAIYRRKYFVEHSMDIWHIDTHHKLIKYGFVVRGGIDGKSRTIVYLDIGCDNTSLSNFRSFLAGVRKFGIPKRTRSDKGGENVEVAEFMLRTRGLNQGSHICGRSVHNQRIERFWRDVHYGCLTVYRHMFLWLENEGHLHPDNPKEIAVLQYIFLPRLKKDLQEFADAWNQHPLSSEHNRTPLQLMYSFLPPETQDLYLQENGLDEIFGSMDFDGSVAENIVAVEPFEEFLSDADKAFLAQFDVMRVSHSKGADIFIDVTNRMRQHHLL